MAQPVFNHKTLIRGSGDLPFDMEIANVHVDLKQDETKIVLGIDHPFSRSEFEFPIRYPNGTPDEMSDRETKLREEIAALKILNADLQRPVSPYSLGKCEKLEDEIGRLKQANSRLQDEAAKLHHEVNARTQSIQEALGERDLYKSQLDALHAKYEAVVAQNTGLVQRNLKLQACNARVIDQITYAERCMVNARNYLKNEG